MGSLVNILFGILAIFVLITLWWTIVDLPYEKVMEKAGIICSVVGGLGLVHLILNAVFEKFSIVLPVFFAQILETYPFTLLNVSNYMLSMLWGIYVFRKIPKCNAITFGVCLLCLLVNLIVGIYYSSDAAFGLFVSLFAMLVNMISSQKQQDS